MQPNGSLNKMPRLLFLEALPTISGGQAVMLSLIPALRQQYDLAALLPGEGPLSEALQAEQVPCYFAPMGQYSLVHKNLGDVFNYLLRFPWLTFFVWRLIRHQHVDLVYANSGRTFLWGTLAAMLAGCPVIWHHHNLFADSKTLTLLKLAGQLPTVRRIICVSEVACRQFPELAAKTVVVPTGIDTGRFHPDPALGAKLRQELGIALDTKVVGIIGDLIPLKGQHTLLEAIPLVSPNVRYLIVGDVRPGDEESSRYNTHLRELSPGNVIFAGRRQDLVAIINALDLLVIASERETGPLVLLEALACGVPVISTPVGRAPELLSSEHMFPVGDTVALADRLQSSLAYISELKQIQETVRNIVVKQLSMTWFSNSIQSEIERSLDNKS